MKIMIKTLIVLVLLILSVIVFFVHNAERFVKNSIISHGSSMTNTNLSIDKVEFSIDGSGKLITFKISNPKGFSKENILVVDRIIFNTNPKSLFTDIVIIESMKVEKPIIRFEIDESGANNIETIIKSIKSSISNIQNNNPNLKKKGGYKKKIILKKFILESADIKINIPKTEKAITLGLSPLTLKNIGVESGGIPAEKITEILLQTINQQILKENRNSVVDFKNQLSDTKKQIKTLESDVKKKLNNQIYEKFRNIF